LQLKDYPFLKFSILFILGIIGEKYFQLSPIVYLIIIASFTLTFFISNYFTFQEHKVILSTIAVYGIIFFTGSFIANAGTKKIQSPLLDYQKEKSAKLFAEVDKVELERSFEIVFNVTSDSLSFDNKLFITRDKLICKFRGDSLQRKVLYDNIKPGNKIFLTGTFQKGRDRRNPGEFDYNKYLLSKGIVGLFISYDSDSVSIYDKSENVFETSLFTVRKAIDKTIHDLHQPQTAGLLRGLLLADRSEIDFETKNDFINSGVIHVLAVSGLHVGYILIIFIFIFGRFEIYTRSILTILGLILFMLITGVPPSVFRATLMAIIIIIAFLSNRSTNIINSIAIAAFIILIFNPSEIYNPGFQLSFAAVLAIGILFPYFQKSIKKLELKHKSLEYILLFVAVSLSAQIGTIPFTLFYFSKLSLVALFSNLFVIPTVGVVIGIAFITIFIASFSYPIAIYFASANDLITSLMTKFINFTGRLDFSFLWIRNYSIYDSLVFYITLILLFIFLRQVNKFYLKILLVLSSVFIIVIFSSFDDRPLLPDSKFSLLMIDVGQGDSFLIKFPNGKTALIDAGEANPYVDNGERIIIPLLDYLDIDKIDYGFISHLDLDHYGGFVSLLYNNRIKEIYRPKPDSSDKSIRFEKYLDNIKIPRYIYHRENIGVGNSVIYILNDSDNKYFDELSSNDKSGFLKIVYDKTSFLFVGDAEIPAESYYLEHYNNFLDSDVLKVGHHGSKTGSTYEFLQVVSPKISLISAGIKNKFGHPSDVVLQRLNSLNSKVFRTDSSGAVLLQSDGQKIIQIDWKNL
jgi:competence protein ComEC